LLEKLNDVAEKYYELLVLNINELSQLTALSLKKWLMKIGVNKLPKCGRSTATYVPYDF
jgi:hypothetical protein